MLNLYDPYIDEPQMIERFSDWLLEDERRLDICAHCAVTSATWAMTMAVLLCAAWVAV